MPKRGVKLFRMILNNRPNSPEESAVFLGSQFQKFRGFGLDLSRGFAHSLRFDSPSLGRKEEGHLGPSVSVKVYSTMIWPNCHGCSVSV